MFWFGIPQKHAAVSELGKHGNTAFLCSKTLAFSAKTRALIINNKIYIEIKSCDIILPNVNIF